MPEGRLEAGPAEAAPLGARTKVATPVFDGCHEEEIAGLLDSTLPNRDGDAWVDPTERRACSTAAPGDRSRSPSRSATCTS